MLQTENICCSFLKKINHSEIAFSKYKITLNSKAYVYNKLSNIPLLFLMPFFVILDFLYYKLVKRQWDRRSINMINYKIVVLLL